MSGSEVDGEYVNQQEEIMEMLRSLVLRRGHPEEGMASDRARGEGQSSPSSNSKMESEPVEICQPLVLYA